MIFKSQFIRKIFTMKIPLNILIKNRIIKKIINHHESLAATIKKQIVGVALFQCRRLFYLAQSMFDQYFVQ